MKRSLFFLITAILGALFGAMMLFMPGQAAAGFGMTPSPESTILFRSLGGMILASGLLNFMVRHQGDSASLKAVLIFNIIFHAISMVNDFAGVSQGVLGMDKIIPGQIAHLFIGVGSLVYIMSMKSSKSMGPH